MTSTKTQSFLKLKVKDAAHKRNQLRGYKSTVFKELKSGKISAAEAQTSNKRINNANKALKKFINHYENKLKTMKGSDTRRKQKHGNVTFF